MVKNYLKTLKSKPHPDNINKYASKYFENDLNLSTVGN